MSSASTSSGPILPGTSSGTILPFAPLPSSRSGSISSPAFSTPSLTTGTHSPGSWRKIASSGTSRAYGARTRRLTARPRPAPPASGCTKASPWMPARASSPAAAHPLPARTCISPLSTPPVSILGLIRRNIRPHARSSQIHRVTARSQSTVPRTLTRIASAVNGTRPPIQARNTCGSIFKLQPRVCSPAARWICSRGSCWPACILRPRGQHQAVPGLQRNICPADEHVGDSTRPAVSSPALTLWARVRNAHRFRITRAWHLALARKGPVAVLNAQVQQPAWPRPRLRFAGCSLESSPAQRSYRWAVLRAVPQSLSHPGGYGGWGESALSAFFELAVRRPGSYCFSAAGAALVEGAAAGAGEAAGAASAPGTGLAPVGSAPGVLSGRISVNGSGAVPGASGTSVR